MKSAKINIKLSYELLKRLDEAAKQAYTNRSDYIRECIVLRLRGNEVLQKEKDEFMERLRQISGDKY